MSSEELPKKSPIIEELDRLCLEKNITDSLERTKLRDRLGSHFRRYKTFVGFGAHNKGRPESSEYSKRLKALIDWNNFIKKKKEKAAISYNARMKIILEEENELKNKQKILEEDFKKSIEKII